MHIHAQVSVLMHDGGMHFRFHHVCARVSYGCHGDEREPSMRVAGPLKLGAALFGLGFGWRA